VSHYSCGVLDLDAYLARIGLSGRPDIAEVHRAHATSIPFENLDPRRGVAVSLAPEDVERKLVAQRRGGYCFEQNLLLKAALEALGAEVQLLLARVRRGAPAGVTRPRSHLVLRVQYAGAVWHADVGFGLGTLLEPLPFGPGGEHEQAGWRFRVVRDGPELVLQTILDGGWADLYAVAPEPVAPIDVDVCNWWTSTHPHSPFVTSFVVAAQSGAGVRTALSDWESLGAGAGAFALTEQTPASTTVSPVAPVEVSELLATRFGLSGFEVGGNGRLARATDG
jgi:N-hydroxyarylamine O-acetyltransferase